MICLRCGYCCIYLDVSIVNPESLRPEGSIDLHGIHPVILKPKGERCPYLSFQREVAECAIHDRECYKGTPCDQFEQVGREEDVCIMGGYFKAAGYRK